MNYFSETISNITISIEDKFNQAEESLELKYRGFQESLKQGKTVIIKRIQEEQEILSEIINDLQVQTKESWESYTQTAIQVLDENSVTITENLNMANNELNSFITSLHDSSKESLDNAVSSNLDILNDLQEETRRISEEGIANLTTTAENQSFSVRQAINQQIQRISEIITDQNDSLNESLSIASNNTIISSNDLIENTKELVKQSFDEQISTIKSKAQKLIESSKMSINDTNTGITASFTDLQEQLNSILQTSEIKTNEIVIQLKELNGKLNGIDQSILAAQNEYLEKVSTSLSNFRNSTQELIRRINTQNLTKLDNFQMDSIELIHNSVEQIKKHNTGLQASINNYLQGLKLGFNFRLNEVETALNRKKESFNHSLKAAVKESKQSLNELIQPSNIHIESVSDKTKIAVEEYLNSTKEETINLFNDLNSNTTDLLENIKEIVEENYQTLKSDSKSLTDEIGKNATSGINTIRNQSEEAMNQISTITQETIFNMKNKTEDGIKQVFNDLINVISDQVPAIFKTGSFDRVVKESENLSQLFTDLLEQVKEHQRPNELTQFIHTKKAIINHVNDWLRTAKAGVNIIVPSYVDLDMDVLKEIPMRRRVTIYTNIGNKAWMEPFINKSNIRFFHLETGEGTQLPPVYAVDRESEEILFAPASEMKAPMAILSSEEPYINAIANILMSQYMAMARQVDPRNP